MFFSLCSRPALLWALSLHLRSLEPSQGLCPEWASLGWSLRDSAFLAGFRERLLLLVWGPPWRSSALSVWGWFSCLIIGSRPSWPLSRLSYSRSDFGWASFPSLLTFPCSSLFFPIGFSVLSLVAFPRVLPSPFLADSPIFVSPPPLAAPFWLGYPDWLSLSL